MAAAPSGTSHLGVPGARGDATAACVDIHAPGASGLFDAAHVPRWTPSLMLYFPLGCVLAALRCGLWIAGIAADQAWFRDPRVVAAYCRALGVRVTWRGEHHIPAGRHVLVSNHVSVGDLLMLFQRPQRCVHLITQALPERVFGTAHLPVWLLPASKDTYEQIAATVQPQHAQDQGLAAEAAAAAAAGHAAHSASSSSAGLPLRHAAAAQQAAHAAGSEAAASWRTASTSEDEDGGSAAAAAAGLSGRQAAGARAVVAAALARGAAAAPLHVFPEGGMTSGRAGMMHFSRGFMRFAAGLPVVPVALRVTTSSPEVSSHTLTSSFGANLFWFSFPLATHIECVALPAMTLQPGESKAGFVRRVQAAVAAELGCSVADLSVQQKRRLAQRAARLGWGGAAGQPVLPPH